MTIAYNTWTLNSTLALALALALYSVALLTSLLLITNRKLHPRFRLSLTYVPERPLRPLCIVSYGATHTNLKEDKPILDYIFNKCLPGVQKQRQQLDFFA